MRSTLEFVLHLPPGEDSPAFWKVCGVTVLQRLAVQAARVGATGIAVVGACPMQLERARRVLARDRRLAAVHLHVGSLPMSAHDRVDVAADVVVTTRVLSLLRDAGRSTSVPGASLLALHSSSDTDAPRALWCGQPPAGCYVVALRQRADRRVAKRAVCDHMASPSSSPVARYFNEKISARISWVMLETPMTPNQMTLLNTVVGVAGGALCAVGDPVHLAAGGALMQVTAILDCCDGEMARAKVMQSDWGAWIDTMGDNVIYIAYMVGLMVGYVRFTDGMPAPWGPWIPVVAYGTLALAVLLIASMFRYVQKNELGGSLTAITKDFDAHVDRDRASWPFRVLDALKVLGRRAQFSLMLAVAAILPWATGEARVFHGLFAAIVVFVAAAATYFGWAFLQRRRTRVA